MNLFHWLSFELWYLHRPPWDSEIVPPEVVDLIAAYPPGHALDLGCGSGTSSLALARAGWIVHGVDFAPHAIRMARQKARIAGLSVDFIVGDVTRLPDMVRDTPYDLVLDIGCFHGLTTRRRGIYLNNLEKLLTPGGIWLLYGFFKPQENPGSGLTAGESGEMEKRLRLLWRMNGLNKKGHPSAWFCFKS
jgi:ubiquinone/menaquinone biosynthesis C-methylase UbiE